MDHVEQLKSALLRWWLAVTRVHTAPERSATYAVEFNSANAKRKVPLVPDIPLVAKRRFHNGNTILLSRMLAAFAAATLIN
jgi:hypothetical protein